MIECHPIGCRVLLKIIDPEVRMSKGGIAIPTQAKERAEQYTNIGEIVEFGPRCNPEYTDGLKVGDIVSFSRYEGDFRSYEGSTYRCVNDCDLWMRIETDDRSQL